MFRHVVMLTLSDDTPDSQRVALRDALAELPAAIPEILDYSVGLDIGENDRNADLVVIGDFADQHAFKIYLDHPAHVRVGAEVGKWATRATRVQYER